MRGHVTLTSRFSRAAGVVTAWTATSALVVALLPATILPANAADPGAPAAPAVGADAVLAALDAGATLDVRTGLEPLPGGGVTGDGLPARTEAAEAAAAEAPRGEVDVTVDDRPTPAIDIPVDPLRPTGVDDEVSDGLSSDETVPVIVRLTTAPDHEAIAADADRAASARSTTAAADTARTRHVVDTLQALAKTSQADVAAVLDRLEADGHATDVQPFWIVNGFAATLDATAIDTLAAHADVASVTLDETHELPAPVEPTDGDPNLPTWSLETIGAPDVWGEYGVRGEGVTIGVLDSGVDGSHPALAGSWRGRNGDTASSWWVGTGEDYPLPGDGGGHGTHVTGSIVGQAPGDVTGVAPGAEWIAAKIFNDGGRSTDATIHSAFQFMLAPGGDPAKAPDIVTNSWGADDGTRTEFWDDVSAVVAAGIVPMFANGNNGPGRGTVGSPGSYPHTIGIGATDANDLVASFSSRGPAIWNGEEIIKPQLSAPGVDIHSTWPTALDSDGYSTISGTSMATPHATGVVALMLSAAPDLTVEEVRAALIDTARAEPHMGEVPNNAYGAGVIDAYDAVTRVAHAGEVRGTITDQETGAPVAATITVADDVEVATDPATGTFRAYVREGTHGVMVEAYGYTSLTTEVTVAVDQVVTLDAALAPAAVHRLTGTVTNAGGGAHVAGATVTVQGTDVAPVRTADDGGFDLEVAAGTHVVAIRANGFAPTSQRVVVDGDVHLDLALDPLTTPTVDGWTQYQNNPGRTGYTASSVGAPTLTEEWAVSVGAPVTFASPTVADGVIYVADDAGRLTARDLATGEERWRVDVASTSVLRGAPLVADGTVYIGAGTDGGITALDAATGEVRWTTPTPDRVTVYLQPTLVDGALYAATGPTSGTSDTVYALDPATGDVRWSTDVGELVYAGPAVADGYVVVGNGDDGRLIALDATTGEVTWTLQRTEDYFIGSPSIADGVVYTTTTAADGSGGGSLLAVDLASGTLLWENGDPGDGQGTTPAVYGDVVVAGSHGTGVVTAYDRVDGSVTWQHPISGAVSASVLTSADGYVVFGSQLDNRVIAVDAATGEEAWSVPVTANVTATAAFADGALVTVDGRGRMTAHTPRGTVAGTVDSGWAPLEATVRVMETGTEVTSDPATGGYELSHKPGTFTLEFVRYGKQTVTETVEIVAGDTAVVDATLRQAPSGSLGGQVVDIEGEPLAGAVVTVEGTTLRPATTPGSGVFFYPTVFTGTYTVTVELDGYVPWSQEVSVQPSQIVSVQPELRPYDVALVGDYLGLMEGVLTDLGYTVDATTYADVTEHADDYATVVVNGDDDDPGQEGFDAFVAATDAAGTSVVWLDQFGISDGGITHLVKYAGDPEATPDELNGGDSVSIEPTVEHPLTEGLELGEATAILGPNSGYSAFTGWSGTSVADLVTDADGRVGAGVGYAPRGTGSVHVLLGSLQAASWGRPDEDWTNAAAALLDNAVRYAGDAAFGEVAGVVSDSEGAPIAGATVASESGGQQTTTAEDGSYRLFVPGGTHDVTVAAVGYVTDVATLEVEAGSAITHDVELAPAGVGIVDGTITGTDGAPVAGATVAIEGPDVTGTTGADGTYTIADVPAGTWPTRVSAPGYLSDTTAVDVARDTTTTHDLALTAATRVGVVGDRSSDSVIPVLGEGELVGVPMEWTDTATLADVDVVVLNGSTDPGKAAFDAFLAAADAESVSVVFTDGRYSSEGSLQLLQEYAGYPAESGDVEGDGPVTLVAADDPPHVVFDGLDPQTQILNSDGRATTIQDYPGEVIAEVGTVGGDTEGAGLAYRPRTPGSVEIAVTGLATSVFQGPADEWTEDGRRLYRNLLTWAGDPGMGGVSGTVSDGAGGPVRATITEVDGDAEALSDPVTGAYTVALAPGEHTMRVEALGFVTAEFTVTVAADQVVTHDLDLERSADAVALSGTVSTSGSVAVPADGAALAPLAGAEVRVLGTTLVTTTGADGGYEFPTLAAGAWTVEVAADGHVRSQHPVDVAGDTVHDDTLRVTPAVGVVDDYQGRTAAYLADWGYEATSLAFTDVDRLAEMDLVVADLASYPVRDPGPQAWAAFRDAALRAGTPIVWLDQYGRGSHDLLTTHEGDPAVHGEDRDQGAVTATVDDPDHPLATDLPASFELVAADGEYSWFDELGGTMALSVAGAADPAQGGGLAGAQGNGASAVDVLVGALSISTYGWPAYGDDPGKLWTAEAEQLLRNALTYALDAEPLGAELRASVTDPGGAPVAATVTVVESGRAFTARDDGSVVVPLDPGTWTVRFERFGYDPVDTTATVAAGDVVEDAIIVPITPTGTVTGVVTDSSGPVEGAALALTGTSLNVTTDATGRYTFADVPQDDYQLRISTDRHTPQTHDVTVSGGQTTDLDVALEIASRIAIVEDSSYGSIEGFLRDTGYGVAAFQDTEMAALAAAVTEYDLVILNGSTASSRDTDLVTLLDAADTAGVSTVVAGHWGGGAVRSVSRARGNPGSVDWSFVEDSTIHYTPTADHPVFAGFPVGEPVTLMGSTTENQQWLSFDDYEGTVVAALGSPVEESLGSGVGYRFTSPTSVELVLASMGASGYGRPDAPAGNANRWTDDARAIYLNAIEWAMTAQQGAVTGLVSGVDGPLAGATVTAEDGASTVTAADGRYTLLLPDGSHTLTVTADAYEVASVPVEIADAATVTADVTLTPLPRVSVTGTVTSAAGESPVAEATVIGENDSASFTATTASDGTYAVSDVLIGEYAVTVTAPGHLATTATLTVTADEPAVFDAALTPVDVAVVDADGSVAAAGFTDWLADRDVAAETITWADAATDLSAYTVVLVNGGDPTQDEYTATVDAAAAAGAALVHLGTWGVDNGGLRILERYTDRITVGSHGYGAGSVMLSLTDPAHPMVAGLDEGATIIGDGGYYSAIATYDGTPVADVVVTAADGSVERGIGVGHGTTAAGGLEAVLSASAVTGDVGPERGWTAAHTTLLLDTIAWARSS